MKWYHQFNDVVGGYIVSNLDRPASDHDLSKDGDKSRRGYIVAETMSLDDAKVIAHLLNVINYKPITFSVGGDAHGVLGWWNESEVQADEGVPSEG